MYKTTGGRYVLLLVILFCIMPFGINKLTNLFLILILINGLIGLKADQWKKGLNSRIFQVSAAYYLFLVLSLLWSYNQHQGLLQLETKLTFLLAPLILIASITEKVKRSRNLLLKAFLAGNFLVSIAALAIATINTIKEGATYYLASDGLTKISFFTYEKLADPFMHPGYLSTFLGIANLICIYFIFKIDNRKKWGYAALLFFFFIVLILVQGRINLLALLVVVATGAFILAVKRKAYVWLLLPALPLILLGLLVAFGSQSIDNRYLQVPDFSYNISGANFNSATYRLAEWACASDVIKKYPLLGTGVGSNNEALLKAYENRGFWAGLEHSYNAHNQYVESTIATGYIGLSFLLFMLFYFGKTALANQDYLTLSCLAFFAICMLTESMLERANAVLLFTSFFPLMLGLNSQSQD